MTLQSHPSDVSLAPGLRWTLVVSCLAVSLVVAAMAALYTALPDIAVGTGASQSQLTWVVDGYTLALACLVLPAGALGDRFGRRAVLRIGLAVFVVASAVPLVTASPLSIIAARTAAGVGAAFVMPSTLSLLTASFPRELRGRAVGIWAGVAGSGGVVGILGSGLLLEYWSWRSVFAGLTVAAAVLLMLAARLPESRETHAARMDTAGAVWIALTISLLVFAIVEGPTRGWLDPVVVDAFVTGLVAGLHFAVVELRSAAPLLDIRTFARRGFSSGSLSMMIQFLITFGLFLVLVQYLQLVLGYSTVLSAVALAPMVLPLIVISPVAPWLAGRVGLRLMTVSGLLTISVGLVLASRLQLGAGYSSVIVPMLIMSTGLGLCAAPATAAIVDDAPAERHGVAAAVNDAARELGAAIGIAVAGGVLAASYAAHIRPALSYLPVAARGPVQHSLAAAVQVADRAGPAGPQLRAFAQNAFLHGMDRSVIVLACISLAGAVLVGFLAPGRPGNTNLDTSTRVRSRSRPTVRAPRRQSPAKLAQSNELPPPPVASATVGALPSAAAVSGVLHLTKVGAPRPEPPRTVAAPKSSSTNDTPTAAG